ncbi:3-oxoacyl-[acyl-carrier-protein] reductase FabG-like [Saccostrea echinata]|uniref:3-oxoacyl-[acyl-carrier-protein] reductase FabG-like n=1 Tax=Saccostrea echinata TaxID=191078 RepID=UPI002A81F69E|nr:3-oxoacyl-[acyl-carrier-protein] reductase FabG-like [Saccostrea echinata]
MMASLFNKVIIITGANSGIGAATALAFAKAGARLVLAARNLEKLNNVANECSAKGLPQEKVLVKGCDVTNEENLKGLVGSTLEKYGQIDVLVNNAGSGRYVNYLETTRDVFDTTFNLNIRAPFFLTKMCTTHLQKTKGCVVNVSSLAGQRTFPIAMVYGMSKAAMDQFTRTLAIDLAKENVRVNSVNPGVIKSFEFQKRAGMTEQIYNQYIEKQKELQPLTGAVEPEEVAKVILFLASDQSSSITGELIYVDGGRHAVMPL